MAGVVLTRSRRSANGDNRIRRRARSRVRRRRGDDVLKQIYACMSCVGMLMSAPSMAGAQAREATLSEVTVRGHGAGDRSHRPHRHGSGRGRQCGHARRPDDCHPLRSGEGRRHRGDDLLRPRQRAGQAGRRGGREPRPRADDDGEPGRAPGCDSRSSARGDDDPDGRWIRPLGR